MVKVKQKKYNWVQDKNHPYQYSCTVDGHRIDRTSCANGTLFYYIHDKNGRMEYPYRSMLSALNGLKRLIEREKAEWVKNAPRRAELAERVEKERLEALRANSMVKVFSDNCDGQVMTGKEYHELTLTMSTGDYGTHRVEWLDEKSQESEKPTNIINFIEAKERLMRAKREAA